MKKFITACLTACLLVISAIILSSCEDDEPNTEEANTEEVKVSESTISNLRSKAELGLREAKQGKFDSGLFWAKQARSGVLDVEEKSPSAYKNQNIDQDLAYIDNIIAQIEEMKKAAAEKKKLEKEEAAAKKRKEDADAEKTDIPKSTNDSLDEANKELETFDFGDNNDDNLPDDPNQYIYKEPTIDSPGSSYEGEW